MSAANKWAIVLCHEYIKLISSIELTCNVLSVIYILMTVFLIFWRFQTTFWRFAKIFQNCSEGQTNLHEHLPRISEHFRRLRKIFEEDSKMFRWCTNKFKDNLRDKPDISEIINIFTCEVIVSFLSVCYHSVYPTDFYIIKIIILWLEILAGPTELF